MITVSATTYAGSGTNCKIMWISETSAARGPMYSAHLQCAKLEEKAPKTQSDVILYPKDDKQISIGPRFSDLKDYQRVCHHAIDTPPSYGNDGGRLLARRRRTCTPPAPISAGPPDCPDL
jgi:hypothetical protein